MKSCKVCGRELPILDFRPTVRGQLWPDGRSNWCEDCIGEDEAMTRERYGFSLSELKGEIRKRVLAREGNHG